MSGSRVQPHLVYPPHILHRVGRASAPLNFSEISAADAALPLAGNRFDVPGEGVCYVASQVEGCYAETLARFRPSPRVIAAVRTEDPNFMVSGGVPADWRAQRLRVECTVADPLPFLDVDAAETHTFLTHELAEELDLLGISELDVAAVRGRNRLLTRRIASWAYGAVDLQGEPLYSGIRYTSRLDDYECWAVFQGSDLRETSRLPILLSDPELEAIATKFNLRLF